MACHSGALSGRSGLAGFGELGAKNKIGEHALYIFIILLHSTILTTIHHITSCHKIPSYTVTCCKTPYSACYTLRTDPT